MRRQSYFLFFIVLILWSLAPIQILAQTETKPVPSQKVFEEFDKLYQIDARLINGDFYQIPKISDATGHPFFLNTDWKKGSVKIEGVIFEDLLLRYDVQSGQVILNTSGFTNMAVQLVLKKDRIDYFTMDGSRFEPFPVNDSQTGLRFCQILEDGQIDFLLLISKSLRVTATGLSDFTYQTNQEKFLRIDEELISYKGRRTLYRLFPDQRPGLKEYIKNNQLRFRHMDPVEHSQFVRQCNKLMELDK